MTANNGQDWQLIVVFKALLVVIMLAVSLALAAMFHDIGKESMALEIFSKCLNHEVITIGGVELHCSIIERVDNIESARYRGVKNCIKIIKEWEDGR